ncbi:MAG TPA: CbtA family protein [Stellaceae bacterium]|nr:CbtA family protein [Stellaceae bacterium]
MVTSLLLRGLLAGLVAGLLAFGFARIFGEPQVDRAIAFEQAIEHARHEAPAPELVSRDTQAGIGLFTGIVVYGVALGGLFSLAFAAAYGRVAALSPRATAALLALLGFLAVVLVPALKYPPNPPAIGDPGTIRSRTALYFVMVALSLATAVLSLGLARRLGERFGRWNGAVLGILGFVLVIAVAESLLPDVSEVPEQFSAVVLWRFRVASLGLQGVFWAALGIIFGIAAENSPRMGGSGRQESRDSAAPGTPQIPHR